MKRLLLAVAASVAAATFAPLAGADGPNSYVVGAGDRGALEQHRQQGRTAHQLAPFSPRQPHSNSRMFYDPANDAGGLAPDIQAVSVQNDDAGGLGMTISTPGFPNLKPNTSVWVYLDTDQNPATGGGPNVTGFDYAIFINGNDNSIRLGRWNGSIFDLSTPQSTLSGSWSSGAQLAINRVELANTTGFNFWITSEWLNPACCAYYDSAPDSGPPGWNYQVLLAPPPPPPPPPPSCIVPNVRGKILATARRSLAARHCRTGRVGRAYSRTIRRGRVISQSSRAGRHLPNGTRINLVVSKGRKH
jgi:PASTA domain